MSIDPILLSVITGGIGAVSSFVVTKALHSKAAERVTSLFVTTSFKSAVQKYCSKNGWTIGSIDDNSAYLDFSAVSGRPHRVILFNHGETIEFAVHTAVRFNHDQVIPNLITLWALHDSTRGKIGFWCIEEIEDFRVLSYMHNAELQLIGHEFFTRVIVALVEGVDRFEQEVAGF